MSDPLFPPGSAIRRVFGHPAVFLGAGRALLMQLAHPCVARAVAEHSDFRHDPFARLARTLDATNTVVYGSRPAALEVAAQVRAVHARVQGPGYAATDPALVLWVHATLVDTALRMHARFVTPVAPAAAEEFYRQAMVMGELFGAPLDGQPPDLVAFRRYVRAEIGSLAGQIDGTQRALAHDVLHPPVPIVVDPAVAMARQLTVGLLPPPLRTGFGLTWDPGREAVLRATGFGARLAATPIRLASRLVGV